LLARRAVYDQIGGLAEGFVMYSEELDWCKRAVAQGWRVRYCGDAHITHHGGKSSEQASARKHIYMQQSKVRYFTKHHGVLVGHLMRAWLLGQYALQWGSEALKWAVGHKRPLRAERLKLYGVVLRSGLRGTN
jgi:N-acetylglucosaminyl-diphospho-decaprenol L-rhamnosyltransferase